ncbi:MAG UNVERIFIED_CONTAM: hypothetical protein LVR29_22350 [Microcystis novacekii LVE1205-3]
MEPTEEQYLVLNALETLGLLLFRVYDEDNGAWLIITSSLTYQIIPIPAMAKLSPRMDALTMKKPTKLQQQEYERIGKIPAKGRQRYLEAGGDKNLP